MPHPEGLEDTAPQPAGRPASVYPLDLDDLDALVQASGEETRITGPSATRLLDAVPALIAELRGARAEVATYRAMERRWQVELTVDGPPANDTPVETVSAEQDAGAAAFGLPRCMAWVREVRHGPQGVLIGPWQPYGTAPPF